MEHIIARDSKLRKDRLEKMQSYLIKHTINRSKYLN